MTPFVELGSSLNLNNHAILRKGLPAAPAEVADHGQPLPPSQYVDDGDLFDIRSLPEDTVVGDTHPSVWAGLELRNQQARQLAHSTQALSASHTTAKRLLSKVGMLD